MEMAKQVYALDLGTNRITMRVQISLSITTLQTGFEPVTIWLTAKCSTN